MKGKTAMEMDLIKSSQYFVFLNRQIPGVTDVFQVDGIWTFATKISSGISVSQITTNDFVCCNLNPVHSSFLTYHGVCYNSTTTGPTDGTNT